MIVGFQSNRQFALQNFFKYVYIQDRQESYKKARNGIEPIYKDLQSSA